MNITFGKEVEANVIQERNDMHCDEEPFFSIS